MLHKYSLNGYNIVLDTESGAVHVFDALSFRMLEFLDESMPKKCPEELYGLSENRKDIINTYGELYNLKKQGLLFSPACEPEKKMLESLKKSPVKAMCLNVAHDCNLCCEYCFAAKGDFGTGRELMPLETGKKAIDFLIKRSGTRRNLEIDFFGGEPLMNFDSVKGIVEYARSIEKSYGKNFRFTITTNGLLLDNEKIEYINKKMDNCVLSLDGRREINDQMRLCKNGMGSYDKILPNFKKLVLNRDKDYYIRGTFTRNNLDFASDVCAIADEGFINTSIEPVVCDENMPYSIKREHLEQICREYEKLAQILLERKKAGNNFNFFHFMIDLDGGPCKVKRLKGCGCGNEYLAVTPNGDIYPCHQFVGQIGYKMGNVLTGDFDEEMKEAFSGATLPNKPECAECFAKYFCSGGCNANNAVYMGSVLKPHTLSCEMMKKRVECAIMIKAAETNITT